MPVDLVREQIPAEEREILIHHLEQDTGAGKHYAHMLRQGVVLKEFAVFPLSAIGELTTFFKNIGTQTSIEAIGTEFFPLRSAYAAFRRAAERHEEKSEKPDFQMIQKYIREIGATETHGKVTAVQLRPGVFQLVDGNKSAIAAHEWARTSGRVDFHLRIYVIG